MSGCHCVVCAVGVGGRPICEGVCGGGEFVLVLVAISPDSFEGDVLEGFCVCSTLPLLAISVSTNSNTSKVCFCFTPASKAINVSNIFSTPIRLPRISGKPDTVLLNSSQSALTDASSLRRVASSSTSWVLGKSSNPSEF